MTACARFLFNTQTVYLLFQSFIVGTVYSSSELVYVTLKFDLLSNYRQRKIVIGKVSDDDSELSLL